MIRVIIATVILLVSLVGSERYAVIANGLLLGGLFTMIYAVGLSAFSDASLSRFVIIGVALLIAVSIGWMRVHRVGPRAGATRRCRPTWQRTGWPRSRRRWTPSPAP